MKKNIIKIFILLTVIIFTGCTYNNSKLELSDAEIEIYNNIKNNEFGSTSPRLLFATDIYAVILDTHGLIIYDLNEGKISHLIDVKNQGFNKLQGFTVTEAVGNNEYVILKNMGDENNYLRISLEDGTNDKVDNINHSKYKEPNFYQLNDHDIEILEKDLLEEVESIKVNNSIIVFTSDYKGKDKDWRLIIFSEDKVSSYKVLQIFS